MRDTVFPYGISHDDLFISSMVSISNVLTSFSNT